MDIQLSNMLIKPLLLGKFRLDGGAMFGSVPKNLWNKRIPGDSENCIPMAARSLLIHYQDKKILVDTGMGEKWGDKQKAIFAIENFSLDQLGIDPEEITDVILTHFHFDHAGGVSKLVEGKLIPCFPQATIHVQKKNYDNALSPNLRERASYLPENVTAIDKSKLNLIYGPEEIFPGISVEIANGHSAGLQWIKLEDGQQKVVFPSDLIPTSHHVSLPYIMGYDMCAATSLSEKYSFLKRAVKEQWLVIYQHDLTCEASRIIQDEKGNFIPA